MKMTLLSAAICLMIWIPSLTLGETLEDYQLKNVQVLKDLLSYNQFKGNPEVSVLFHFVKEQPTLKSFMKEFDAATEVLYLYGVQGGVVDCNEAFAADITPCRSKNVDNVIYTYRGGKELLPLELETMFDVDSIMSNVLQLVMLRDVPILQTETEMNKYLDKQRGRYDVIFGQMTAIGTPEHRVFMEVAFAYLSVFKFAISTNKETLACVSKSTGTTGRSSSSSRSTFWWIQTRQMKDGDKDFHSAQYRGIMSLTDFAGYISAISKPAMFEIPAQGLEHPYGNILPIVRMYYDQASREMVYKAAEKAKEFVGYMHFILIDVANPASFPKVPYSGPTLPAISVHSENKEETFMTGGWTEEAVEKFIEDATPYSMSDGGSSGKDEYVLKVGSDEDDKKSMPQDDADEVEKQDDPVVLAVKRTKFIPMTLDRVTALTDKSFPQTLSETQSSRPVVTLFYFPLDALSMANLRMFGEAVEILGMPSRILTTRVNCQDWTDVCQAQNVTMFPTLRVYQAGEKMWDYKGPQDTHAMYSTLQLLDYSPPVRVTEPTELMNYLIGQREISQITNVTVVGLFSDKNKQEIETFRQVAAESPNDRILYVYMDTKDAVQIAKQFEVTVPAVILSRFSDKIQPHVTYTGNMDVSSLKEFVFNNKLPKLTVLTPLMFPELRARGSDFVILFTDGKADCQQPEEVLRKMVTAQIFQNVSFTMMPVHSDKDVGHKVLMMYTKDPQIPHISYVNLDKGMVYNYMGEDFQEKRLSKWIGAVMDRTVQPSVVLKEGKWTPVVQAYDFLKMMDMDKEKNKDKQKMESVDDIMEVPDESPESVKMTAEDAGARKHLFDQKSSRLHAGRGRMMMDRHDGRREMMEQRAEDDDANLAEQTDTNMEEMEHHGHDPSEL